MKSQAIILTLFRVWKQEIPEIAYQGEQSIAYQKEAKKSKLFKKQEDLKLYWEAHYFNWDNEKFCHSSGLSPRPVSPVLYSASS